MNKFKVDDTVKTSLGYGVVHEVSENGMRYLIDDDTDFGWFAEKDIELNEKINILYRTITGRIPNKKEVTMLNNYFDDENSLNEEVVAFDKLCMLIYNLDETSQKS